MLCFIFNNDILCINTTFCCARLAIGSLLYTNAGFRFNSNIRIFGKGEVNGHRRLGVLLARDISVEKALEKVERAYAKLDVKL